MVTLFFLNDTATTEIYTLSLHDALPISAPARRRALRRDRPRRDRRQRPPSRAALPRDHRVGRGRRPGRRRREAPPAQGPRRSEEHTSELQSRQYLVCRLLLEKQITALTH